MDIPLSAECFRYMAGWATKIQGTTVNLSVPYTPGAEYQYTLREPLGVVGRDHPVELSPHDGRVEVGTRAGFGLHGCPQAGEQTPLSALRLGELV